MLGFCFPDGVIQHRLVFKLTS